MALRGQSCIPAGRDEFDPLKNPREFLILLLVSAPSVTIFALPKCAHKTGQAPLIRRHASFRDASGNGIELSHWVARAACPPVSPLAGKLPVPPGENELERFPRVSRLDISREARTTTGSVGHPPAGALRPRDNACYRAASRAAPRVVEPVRGSQWQGFGTAGARLNGGVFFPPPWVVSRLPKECSRDS